MSCFVSHNDVSMSIWPVWSMNFNNFTLWKALLWWVWREFIIIYSLHFVQLLGIVMLCKMQCLWRGLTAYLQSSASHQSISLCLCSSHGINTNSPLSSKLGKQEPKAEKGKDREKILRCCKRRVSVEKSTNFVNIRIKNTYQVKDQLLARSHSPTYNDTW